MAGSKLDELAKQPLPVKIGIAAGVGVLLLGLYWQFSYSGLGDDLKKAKQQTKSLQKQNQDLKASKAKWEELSLEKGRLDAKLAKNRLSLPSSTELPAFFISMQKQMAASGAELEKWSVGKEEAIDKYFKVPVSIEMTGTFYQINNYFYLLSQSDRIITVENLSLTSVSKNGTDGLLNAKLTASTFRQDPPPVVEEEPEEPTKAKGKKK